MVIQEAGSETHGTWERAGKGLVFECLSIRGLESWTLRKFRELRAYRDRLSIKVDKSNRVRNSTLY